MADKKCGDERTEVQSSAKELSLEFELDEMQQKTVMECIRKTGKISIKLGTPSVSKLPGRGQLDDTDGKLID